MEPLRSAQSWLTSAILERRSAWERYSPAQLPKCNQFMKNMEDITPMGLARPGIADPADVH